MINARTTFSNEMKDSIEFIVIVICYIICVLQCPVEYKHAQ